MNEWGSYPELYFRPCGVPNKRLHSGSVHLSLPVHIVWCDYPVATVHAIHGRPYLPTSQMSYTLNCCFSGLTGKRRLLWTGYAKPLRCATLLHFRAAGRVPEYAGSLHLLPFLWKVWGWASRARKKSRFPFPDCNLLQGAFWVVHLPQPRVPLQIPTIPSGNHRHRADKLVQRYRLNSLWIPVCLVQF